MAPTSDERREVAERLRGALTKNQMKRAIGLSTETDYMWQAICCRLADLIEPQKEDTCCDVSDDESVFECSRCGCVVRLRTCQADAFENVTYGPALMMPNGSGGKLSFCPHCGAMVVSDDD